MNSGWREPSGQWARLRPKQPDGPVRGEAGGDQTPSCAAVPPPARGLTGQMLRVSIADFYRARYWRSEALEERDGRRLPVPAPSGGGRLTEPTPAVEPSRRERVKVPHSRPLPTARAFQIGPPGGASQGNGTDPHLRLVLCAEIERDSSSQTDAVRRTRLQTIASHGADSFAL
jgi:hypothetical protein